MSGPSSFPNNSPQVPELVKVEALHLDATGYGPEGTHTRRQWREACLSAILEGRDAFQRWTAERLRHIKRGKHLASFAVKLTFADGQTLEVLGEPGEQLERAAIDLAGVSFDETLNLGDYQFAIDCVLVGAQFRKSVNLRGASWHSVLHAEQVRFLGPVKLASTQFHKDTFFGSSHFGESASFDSASCTGIFDLRGAQFKSGASFTHAKVENVALFTDAVFSQPVLFDNAVFKLAAEFESATFWGEAFFDAVTFAGPAGFELADFNGTASFFRSMFEHEARFVDSKFRSRVNFENATFQNVGHFEGAVFFKASPSFLAVKLETTLVFSGSEHFPDADISPSAVKHYEFLKQLSEAQGQTEQALDFNALELRARRLQPDAVRGFRVATWLYEYLSDYGRSFVRPLGVYAALLLLTFCLALGHAGIHSPTSCPGEPEWRLLSDLMRDDHCAQGSKANSTLHLSGYRAAGEYAVYRAAGVLDFADNDKQTEAINRRLFRQPIEPWWMRIYGVFKAIASTTLLFLAALGLRNRYRLK